MEGLIDDIFKFGSLMPRLHKQHNQSDYLGELDEIAELSDIRDEILSRVSAAITQVYRYTMQLMQFLACVCIHHFLAYACFDLRANCLQGMEFCNSYENYAYLWVDDRGEFLRQFLLYGHVLTPEEVPTHCTAYVV